MADFVKQHILIEPLYSVEVRESVLNDYPKFQTLFLNIDCNSRTLIVVIRYNNYDYFTLTTLIYSRRL